MTYDEIDQLRERHSAWALLRAQNVAFILSFLSRVFVDANQSNVAASRLIRELDDELYALNRRLGEGAYPRSAKDYLDDWSNPSRAWLRRYYPPGADEPHYDLTPAVEKAIAWVGDLEARTFIGTESRLNTIFDLLRQMVHGADTDPEQRLAELHERRRAIDAEIARVEAGHVDLLDPVGQRDRYQQFARTARELLSDFRQVEENFRQLDRQLREQIAGWSGSKGELLDEVLGDRTSIAESDQGRSFRAFYEVLLSAERQRELSELLDRLKDIDALTDRDARLDHIHYDWLAASDRTQNTVRLLSEQLRRFLDDQVWLENRRVFDLLRGIESKALTLRNSSPTIDTTIDDNRPQLTLPVERPLYRRTRTTALANETIEQGDTDFDSSILNELSVVNRDDLLRHVLTTLGPRGRVALDDVITSAPLEHGLAELITYLSLREPGLEIVFDDDGRAHVSWTDTDDDDLERVADVPRVTFVRDQPKPEVAESVGVTA